MARALLLRHLLAATLAGVAIVAGSYWVVLGSAPIMAQDRIAKVSRGDIEILVAAVGSVQPLSFTDVGAQVSGQLKKLYVRTGDEVRKGQLLAEIDAAVQSTKVDADHAAFVSTLDQLNDKQASLALAQTQADRQKRLRNLDATSENSYETAIQALKSARATVASLEAQIVESRAVLAGDRTTLGFARIYAPLAGTVASESSQEGQTLNASLSAPAILRISNLSTMTVQTQVSEADVPKLRVGMKAYFTTLGAGDRRWYGTLRQIEPTPTVTNNVVLYTALFDVKNADRALLPQMTAQVFFIVESAHNVVVIPLAALHLRSVTNNTPTVTVLNRGSERVTRRIRTGVKDRVNAEVLSGVLPGDWIVVGTVQTQPAARIAPDQPGPGEPPF